MIGTYVKYSLLISKQEHFFFFNAKQKDFMSTSPLNKVSLGRNK